MRPKTSTLPKKEKFDFEVNLGDVLFGEKWKMH